jgi:hypothetical protein
LNEGILAPSDGHAIRRESLGLLNRCRALLIRSVLQHSHAFHRDERTACDHLVQNRKKPIDVCLVVDNFNDDRQIRAETVAFVVSHAIGLDTTTAASDYIQLYSGNKETLLASLEDIRRTATQILEALRPCAGKQP